MAITDKTILAAAEALRAEGLPLEKITNTAIRERLGGGSFSQISPVMASWRKVQLEAASHSLDSMPASVRTAFDSGATAVWAAVETWAQGAIRAGVTSQLSGVADEQREALAEVGRLEGEATALRESLARREDELVACRAEIGEQRDHLARMNERTEQAEREAATLRAALAAANEDKAQLERGAGELREEVSSLKERIAARERQEREALAAAERLRGELQAIAVVREREAQAQEKQAARMEDLREECTRHRERVAALELLAGQSEGLTKTLESLREDLAKARDEAAEMRGRLAAASETRPQEKEPPSKPTPESHPTPKHPTSKAPHK